MDKIFFHIDVNSAFLSWSAIEHLAMGGELDYRTVPAIIGGDTSSRHGIVLAKSIPAKAYKIETAEPVTDALKKCPSLLVIPPDMHLYQEKSRALMELLSDFCPDIEQVSVDECYMDYTPVAALHGDPVAAANMLKDRVRDTFGFTVNIGISDRKVLAKMASDFKKPDLVHTLFHDEIQQKMWPLPVTDLFFCGKSSAQALRNLEIQTIGDLAQCDPAILESHLKSHGITLWNFANGIDDSVVNLERAEVKGVGNSTTLPQDATTFEEICTTLLALADSVSGRLRKKHFFASSVSVEIKYSTFASVSHQTMLSKPTNSAPEIHQAAVSLAEALWNGQPVRLLGIRTTKLTPDNEPVQMSLFDYAASKEAEAKDSPARAKAAKPVLGKENPAKPSPDKERKLNAALDSIREKYGKHSITRGSLMKPDKK